MKIAVDFDGTIVKYAYPKIGKEIPFAIETLKLLQREHYQLILWTVREGVLLNEAVAYCEQRGLYFYAINSSFPKEDVTSCSFSRKIKVDLFIDDTNLGGLLDWGLIYKIIHNKLSLEDMLADNYHKMKRKRFKWFW